MSEIRYRESVTYLVSRRAVFLGGQFLFGTFWTDGQSPKTFKKMANISLESPDRGRATELKVHNCRLLTAQGHSPSKDIDWENMT